MRKTALAIVLLYVISTCLFAASRAQSQEGPRIFSSLEDVVFEPGRPLLLVFFSLDCHVCWEELFEMRHFLRKHNLPIDLVGITAGPREELEDFLAKYEFRGPVVWDRGRRLYRRFKVRLEPFRVVLIGGRPVCEDDYDEDFFVRRERIKQCLLEIALR